MSHLKGALGILSQLAVTPCECTERTKLFFSYSIQSIVFSSYLFILNSNPLAKSPTLAIFPDLKKKNPLNLKENCTIYISYIERKS